MVGGRGPHSSLLTSCVFEIFVFLLLALRTRYVACCNIFDSDTDPPLSLFFVFAVKLRYVGELLPFRTDGHQSALS